MNKQGYRYWLFCIGCICIPLLNILANPDLDKDGPTLENPITVAYIQKNLKKTSPKLVLNKAIEKQLIDKLLHDPVVFNMYQSIKMNADTILEKPLLQRIQTGRRLLSVSREFLYRMNILGMTYRIDQKPEVLKRINQEIVAVCNFSDWNPSHFLDVAEMSMGLALAIDWTCDSLPKSTIKLAKKALIEKGLEPSFDKKGNNWWINGTNNWNQVCHGGMIAAAIMVADDAPALAARTIRRALENMPLALAEYGPDGIYPEGSTYWAYGTSYSVLTASILESAFGTDFGLGDYPAFKESAWFRVLANAPSGWYYNFADCGDQRKKNGDLALAWFAAKTGNPLFLERDLFLQAPEEMSKLSRFAGVGLVWLSQFEAKDAKPLPNAWKGVGPNPVVFFSGGKNDPMQYYLGAKGGKGSVNHGNMDAGSFIFELNGLRWVVDPGNQNYHNLEKTGFNLWERCQECERWTLLTKNNFGHSTLSVNNALHQVDGKAEIIDFKAGQRPEATIDLSPVFEGQLASAQRTFIKDSPSSLIIEDQIELNESTELITWQLMTTAAVELVEGGAILKQDGKQLKLEQVSHPELSISIIALDPPPLALDRRIENLKRLELRIPAYLFPEGKVEIKVRLSTVPF